MTAGPLIRALYDMRILGADNIPARGPAIIAPNHLSAIDPVFVLLASRRRVTYIGKADYWDSWKTRWFVELGGVIPVRREDSLEAQGSLRAGISVLRSGRLLGIFPEGTRSPDGRLFKGKTGVARMALEARCPVIPTGLIGTREVLPKQAKVPALHRPVTVRFGTPMTVPPEAHDDRLILREFVDDLMHEIAALTGQTYRHRYSFQKKMPAARPPTAIGS